MASRPSFGVLFGRFEPFGTFGRGPQAPSGSGPPKVGVKLGEESN